MAEQLWKEKTQREAIKNDKENIKRVALAALSILEKKPAADHFFDGINTRNDYKTCNVSVFNILDGASRVPPIELDVNP